MAGMSNKEIEKRQNELYFKYYGNDVRIPENLKEPWSKEDKAESHELDFRSWVNSCLIYGCNYELTAENLQEYDRTIGKSSLELYHIELDRALEIIEEQKERFKSAKVIQDVYTDSEGCTYNSCLWEDDN